jgi:hypothetical protein
MILKFKPRSTKNSEFKAILEKRIPEGIIRIYFKSSNPDFCFKTIEEFIIYYSTRWQKILARFFGHIVYLGEYRPADNEDDLDFTEYYLIWCSRHRRYYAVYHRGYEANFVCPECDSEMIEDMMKGSIKN